MTTSPYHESVNTAMVDRLRAASQSVFADLPVAFAYLFGSQATGGARPDSDVDVAVRLSHDVDDTLSLRFEVSQRFLDAGIGRVEAVVFDELPLALRGRIVAAHEVLYTTDEPTRVALESRVFREYGDFQIAFRGLDKELLTAIAEGRR